MAKTQPIEGLPDVDDSWHIKREHLIMREEIGKGAPRPRPALAPLCAHTAQAPLALCTRRTTSALMWP